MQSSKKLLSIILSVGCLVQVAADIYSPSIPAIAEYFNSEITYAQISMSIYMLGVAISILIYGPLSDALGRKSILVVGLSIMLFGNLLCMYSINIEMLIIGRFIQGLGAGAATTWRSIIRDVMKGEELSKYVSYLYIFITFIIPSAPALGGVLQEYFGWKGNFTFMCIYTIGALIATIFLFEETNKNPGKEKLKLPYIVKSFVTLFTSTVFMNMAIATFLTYGVFFSWFTVGPALLIDQIGISPERFGLITFFVGCISFSIGGFINGRLVVKWGINNMLRLGWGIMIFSGILMLLGRYIFGITEWAIIIPFAFMYFGSIFIWPNAYSGAITNFGDIAGYAAALYGFMQVSGGSIISIMSSYLPCDTQVPFALIIIFLTATALISHEYILLKK